MLFDRPRGALWGVEQGQSGMAGSKWRVAADEWTVDTGPKDPLSTKSQSKMSVCSRWFSHGKVSLYTGILTSRRIYSMLVLFWLRIG